MSAGAPFSPSGGGSGDGCAALLAALLVVFLVCIALAAIFEAIAT